VEVVIDKESENDFYNFMIEKHIPNVLKTGCFISNTIRKKVNKNPLENSKYVFDYYCDSSEKLGIYTTKYSPALQEEVKVLFDGKIQSERYIYEFKM